MKHWATLFLMGFFLFSCASTIGTLGLENKVKKLRIDMTQEEAFQVVGENYQIMMVSKTEEGDLEILRYISPNRISYLLYFINGKLIEFHEEIRDPNSATTPEN